MSAINAIRKSFSTIVFDCDGVVLDSNRIKTDAFRQVAQYYGSDAADALVQFHVERGGISRYRKFEYFLEHILQETANELSVRELADAYGERVYKELLQCGITPGLRELRKATANQSWMIVSGGDQAELRRVFMARKLEGLFDRGIHGSPTAKEAIVDREIASKNLELPALFIGDSRYDHEVASRAGLKFLFVSGWSEFPDWQAYCEEHRIPVISHVGDLLSTREIDFQNLLP